MKKEKCKGFTNCLTELRGDLDRMAYPTMSVAKIKHIMLRLIDITIEENIRLNDEINNLKNPSVRRL